MSSTDTTTVEQKVFEALAALGTEAEITRDASLEELDVDSLDLAEFAQIIDEDLGVRLEGKDMQGRQDRRRRRRPHRRASGLSMSRTSSSPGSAPSRRWAWAPTRCCASGSRATTGSAAARRPARSSTRATVMTAKEARRADRFTQLAVGAAEEAIAQARLERPRRHARVGCIVGTGIGGHRDARERAHGARRAGPRPGSAAGDPADDEQRRARGDRDAPRRCAAPSSASSRVRRRRPRDRRAPRARSAAATPTSWSPAAPRRR